MFAVGVSSKLHSKWLTALAAMLAVGSAALAQGHDCCKLSPAALQSEFFGYYPTCWRQFPPGRPVCPNAPLPAKPPRKPKPEGLELLPMPKPEESR
jgi:hypothetical protein